MKWSNLSYGDGSFYNLWPLSATPLPSDQKSSPLFLFLSTNPGTVKSDRSALSSRTVLHLGSGPMKSEIAMASSEVLGCGSCFTNSKLLKLRAGRRPADRPALFLNSNVLVAALISAVVVDVADGEQAGRLAGRDGRLVPKPKLSQDTDRRLA